MLDFEQRIRQLSPRKRALLAERLKPYTPESTVTENSSKKASTRLVGYVVPQPDQEVSSSQLREFLGNTLPDYMIPNTFVLLDSLPRTPNGKLDRQALPAPNADALPGEAFIAPRNTVEQEIAAIWADMLGLETISIHDNFFEIGGDSILSIQIVAKARQSGLHFTPAQLFQYQTVAELAAVVGTSVATELKTVTVSGKAPLTPIQHWFFEQNFADFHHWNQSLLLETSPDLNLELLEKAAHTLLAQHDALRLSFKQTESGWEQNQQDAADIRLTIDRIDLSYLNPPEQLQALEAAAALAQPSLKPLDGQMVKMVCFHLGAGHSSRLLIVIHHLVIDTVSWQILLEDMETAYHQLQQGKTIVLPPKTTSYLEWAQRLSAYAREVERASERDFWLSQYTADIAPVPLDRGDASDNTEDSTGIVTLHFSDDDTKTLLTEIPTAYNMQIHEALLTALSRAFWRWTTHPALLVGLESHGRQDIIPDMDLSRTVGWFTGFFPVLLQTNGDSNLDGDLKATKERIRTLPHKGLSYGLLRYASGDAALRHELQNRPQPDVLFNYLGQIDQMLGRFSLFKLASESSGPAHSPRAQRHHLLEINAMIRDERLQIQWMYSRNLHNAKTIEYVGHLFEGAVREIVDWCRSGAGGGYTPSDFPESDLSQAELDDLLAELDQ